MKIKWVYFEYYFTSQPKFHLQSTPPLSARLNYAELQLTNEVPKIMDLDKHIHVVYAETKPA